MRRALPWVGGVLGLFLAAMLLQLANAEWGGEVVVLRTTEQDGSPRETRLWIVDDRDAAWLRARGPDTPWLRNLEERPQVQILRGGRVLEVRATPEPAAIERVDELMHEAYGLNENLRMSVLLGRDSGIPVRLEPALR